MNCVFIRGLDMPGGVRGVTVTAPDDDYIIFLNTCLCPETQKRALAHEMNHIKQDHFYNEEPVIINEMEANV